MSGKARRARRLLALWLVTAFLGGPLGLAGVFHSFDDDACEAVRGRAAVLLKAGGPGGTADQPDHCPACHLLRSARWIGSQWPPVLHAPLPSGSAVRAASIAHDDRLATARPARSPPSFVTSRFL